jgi:alkylation response protein AidB-like acyl-CoA dehydrogenase
MATTMLTKQRSCAFLIEPAPAGSTFTPEDFDSETRMMGKAADDFVRHEVLPLLPEIEQAKEGLMRELDRKMGELGFTAAEVPTHYGGLDLPKTTVALIVEKLGPEPATCLTLQAHAGLAILPLVLEGTPAQKERYLPKLASGEWCGSFCLSEPSSGSDALAMRTRAVPTDGGYSAQRREDVGHQRGLRRPVHRVRQAQRRAVHRVSGGAHDARRQLGARGA